VFDRYTKNWYVVREEIEKEGEGERERGRGR
jgi:hypothetical protein